MSNNIAYKVVFDKIMESLDKGVAPWRQPWSGVAPMNGKSKYQYRGINYWLLSSMNYSDPRWFTFRQVTQMGGKVKKGEKSTPVVFWTFSEWEDKKTGDIKKAPFLRYYNVFNASQIDGLNLPKIDDKPKVDPNISGEQILGSYIKREKISLIQGNRACYSPKLDTITMPAINMFDQTDSYYQTYVHECIHSVAHPNRLNQKDYFEKISYGSENYSRGELVAELGSAFICHSIGLNANIESSASYIEGWKSFLKSDPQALIKAASDAQKCADYILEIKEGDIESSEE